MNQPTVFVVIPNWNLKEDTIACIASVLAGHRSRRRVVVVDNGSLDGSPEALAERFGDAVEQILNKENLGYAGGTNVGIRYALAQGADYILLLNNDTVLDENLIEYLIEFCETDPTVSVIGPAIYYHDNPDRFWRLGAVKRWWMPVPSEIGRDALDTGQFPAPFDVDYVTGCAMWVPAELFRAIGLLDEEFFMYYEDADFCERVRNAGHRITVVPRARVWHKVSRSTKDRAPWAAYHQTRNRVIFYNRSKKGLGRAVTNLYIITSTLVQLARASQDKAFAASLWSGLRDGWKSRQDNLNTEGSL